MENWIGFAEQIAAWWCGELQVKPARQNPIVNQLNKSVMVKAAANRGTLLAMSS